MSKLILLTGATGFIGRQILGALLARQCQVRIVARSPRPELESQPGIESVRVTPDLFDADSDWLADLLLGVDTVIHAAWFVEPGKYLDATDNFHCLEGTMAMARAAARQGVSKFVGLGTCFEYALGDQYLDTNSPLQPSTLYAAAKASLFMILANWFGLQDIAFAWCRLFYLYGEGEDPRRFVAYLRRQLEHGEPALLSEGNQVRDFMDVRDAGEKIARVALEDFQGPLNICTGQGDTIRNLALNIAREYGREDLLQFGARPDNSLDPASLVGNPSL